MALDGAFLHWIQKEIEAVAIGARVDKVAQPSRDEILLHLRWRGGNAKLLLSAAADSPRIHFTHSAPENPAAPPMFCMLLRKHLVGGRLAAVRQLGMDRILYLDFACRNELGDLVTLTLAVEIMSRHSNIILIGSDGRIHDAIHRVSPDMSSVRLVLPGETYTPPPAQDRINPLEATPGEIIDAVRDKQDLSLSNALLQSMQGVSPLLGREIACRATGRVDDRVSQLENHHYKGLRSTLDWLLQMLQHGTSSPVMLVETSGRPKDFSFFPITQYGDLLEIRAFPDCSSLLDTFYTERALIERMRQRSRDLLNTLANLSSRITRRTAAQQEELLETARRDDWQRKGDLLSAYLHTLEKGQSMARIPDFYQESAPEVDIPLDPQLSPAQNAQRYYRLYRKADTAEKKLAEQVRQGEEELQYIDTVFDALTRARTEAELEAIRQELAQEGYLRRPRRKTKQREQKLSPLRYRSDDGFLILVGRNNLQNDRLTLRDSQKQDLWLHTQKIPGSHVIIVTEGQEPPRATIEQAATLAAWHSRAQESTKVPVDFTQVRRVKKIPGAKPGMVTYDQFETVIVNPDPALAERLLQA